MEDALVREGVVDTRGTTYQGVRQDDDQTAKSHFARIANGAGLCVFAAMSLGGIWLVHLLRDLGVWTYGGPATLAAVAATFIFAGLGARAVRRRMEEQIATVAATLTNTADRDLTAALDCLPQGVAIWDTEQRLIAANDKFRNTVPRMAAALKPGVVFEHVKETEIAAGYTAAEAADRRPLLRNVDGHDYRIQEIPTESGGSITIATDVTARRARERAIKDIEERYDMALLAANEGIWDLDLRTNKFFISPRALNFIGFEGDADEMASFTPKQWLARIHKDDRKAYFENWRQHLRGASTAFRAEYRIKDGQGGYRWIFDRALALRDSTGAAYRIGGSMSDINERKAAQQALHESQREAEIAVRSKSEFLANMGHELRTPLHAIIGFSDLLRDGNGASEDYREYAEYIREAGEQLDQIVTQLLNFARADSGALELHESTMDLAVCVQSAHAMVAQQAEDKGIEFVIDLPANLPPLIADEGKIGQALHHLLTNAVKYTGPGGRVMVEARWTLSKGIRIDVHDTGRGMTGDEIKHCLEPFASTGATLNRGGGGPGLGLSIVKSFIELHHGTFVLESEPGKGTTATIRLPADRLA